MGLDVLRALVAAHRLGAGLAPLTPKRAAPGGGSAQRNRRQNTNPEIQRERCRHARPPPPASGLNRDPDHLGIPSRFTPLGSRSRGGYPPLWSKSSGYRARAVRDPAPPAAEWKTILPEGTRIASSIPPPITVGWCCRSARPAPKAGPPSACRDRRPAPQPGESRPGRSGQVRRP
jgi:hypothetical protein